MATLGFMDSDGVDLGNKYVTKDYVMTWYPNLPSGMVTPQLWCSGGNSSGQLGINVSGSRSSLVQTITGGTNWKLISSGTGAHAAAIKTDGTLWTWGSDNYGQLGDNSVTNKSSPVQTITGGTNWQQVSIGGYHTMAIKTDGTLWTWGGFNLWGQLGVNDTVNRSSPIQTVTGGTNWKSISAGQYHSIAIKTDGTMWGFGSNGYGALGDGSGVHRSSPVQAFGVNTTWKQVSAARDYTVAIRSDNTLWTCGYNNYGTLGNNSTTRQSSPVQTVTGGSNWKQVSAGEYHVAAIKLDGTLWTWGRNHKGQLGDNSIIDRSSPVTVSGGGTTWKQVSVGSTHTVAIKTDGSLWSCGYNGYGQLADSGSVDKSSFVNIGGVNTWKSVSCTAYTTYAISEASGW